KGLKYGPLQKLRGVIATSSPPGLSKPMAKARNAAYKLLVSIPTKRKDCRTSESELIFRYGGFKIAASKRPARMSNGLLKVFTAKSMKSSAGSCATKRIPASSHCARQRSRVCVTYGVRTGSFSNAAATTCD